MAESAVERLKRQARERKEALAAAASVSSETVTKEETKDAVPNLGAAVTSDPVDSIDSSISPAPSAGEEVSTSSDTVVDNPASELPEPTELATLSDPVTLQKASRTHPLVREMEELEAALEQNVPGFVTLLRDIHKKLAEDPLTVTLLSREEIGTIVKGMTRHANVTIATKAVKSSSRAKKAPVSVSDL